MPYPKFTKDIIQHFISKDKSVSMRNKLFMHSIKDDSVLGILKFVAKGEDNQVYGVSIPDVMINQEIENSKAYPTYLAYSTGASIPKKARKWKQAATKLKTTSSFTTDENIISDDTDVVLANKPTGKRRQTSVAIRDTPTMTKKKTQEQSLKLKGMEMLSVMLATDTRKAMKASLRDLISQHQPGGSSEGAGITPKVPDESQAKSTDINEGVGIISKSEKETTESGKNDDDMSIDLDETDNEEDEHVDDETQRDEYVHEDDEYVHEDDEYVHEDDEHVHDYMEEELNDAEIAKTVEGNREFTDANKAKVEKTEETKDDEEQVDNTLASVEQAKVLSTQANQAAALTSVTKKKKPELPPTSFSLSLGLFSNLKPSLLSSLKYLNWKKMTKSSNNLRDALQKVLQKHADELRKEFSQKDASEIWKIKLEHATKEQLPKHSAKPFDQAARAEFDQKEILFHMMRENKSYENHPPHQALYDALLQSKILNEDDMEKDKTVEHPTQKKRQHNDKNQGPPAGPDQGLKKRKANKDAEPSKKLTSVAPTPDPEWSKGKLVDNEPAQNWLNDLANAEKPPLTFYELMITPIDFSAYAMNRLKISKLTKADLVGPVYNLLKGTHKSYVELEYNIEECYRALSDQLD
ncbi:hypothetical protein Tco_0000013 [Tanacetum coccineum]